MADNQPATIQLSPEQFNEIVRLLTPGYILSKHYLDQMSPPPDDKLPPPPADDP